MEPQPLSEFPLKTKPGIATDTDTDTGPKKCNVASHRCETCEHEFKKRCDLQRHIRIHTGEKPYACGICWKNFRVQSTCHAHVKTHGKSENVSCSVCHNSLANKNCLRVHMRLHTGAKPYSCPHCNKSFRTPGHRKSHVSSSHLKVLQAEEKESSRRYSLENRRAALEVELGPMFTEHPQQKPLISSSRTGTSVARSAENKQDQDQEYNTTEQKTIQKLRINGPQSVIN